MFTKIWHFSLLHLNKESKQHETFYSQKKKSFIHFTGRPKKSDNKAYWVLAWMFLIVGARFHHSWIGRKEVIHAWLVCKIIYHIERFSCRCLINETEFWCYMSKECATATLCETARRNSKCQEGHQMVPWARPHRWPSEKRQKEHNQYH